MSPWLFRVGFVAHVATTRRWAGQGDRPQSATPALLLSLGSCAIIPAYCRASANVKSCLVVRGIVETLALAQSIRTVDLRDQS